MLINSYKKNQRGQGLLELIIAIGVITVGLLAVWTLFLSNFSGEKEAGTRIVAVNLAREGIEVVKNILDKNIIQQRPWNEGVGPGDYEVDYASVALSGYSGRTLNFDPVTGFYTYAAGTATSYLRKISIEQISPDQLHVRSILDWVTRDGATFQIITEDYFFNWR